MEKNEKIKLAIVKGDNWSDYEARYWQELENDLDITVFSSLRPQYDISQINMRTVKLPCSSDNFFVKNYYKYAKGQYKTMFGLEKKLIGFDVAQVVELYNFFSVQAIRAKKYNPKLKVVVHVSDNIPGRFEYNYWPGFKMPPRYWRKKINDIMAEVAGKADLFLGVTQYSADMLEDMGINKNKIRVLGPAVVMPANVDKRELFDKLQLGEGRELYLAVNRLVKEKGVYEVLYAWRVYIKENKDTSKLLLIIGNGPEKFNMERLIKEWRLEKQVKIISNLPNQIVRSLYRFATCSILASLSTSVWQEQFGYVLAEAISSNCPVISTWSGAIPEVVGDAGILFSPGNYIELKRALKKMDDKDFRAGLRANCEKIKYKYSVSHYREILLEGYKQIMSI